MNNNNSKNKDNNNKEIIDKKVKSNIARLLKPKITNRGKKAPTVNCVWDWCPNKTRFIYDSEQQLYCVDWYCSSHKRTCSAEIEGRKCQNRDLESYSKYCSSHRCKIDGCNYILHNLNYCKRHGCSNNQCKNRCGGSSVYCDDHISRCIMGGCTEILNQSGYWLSDYCDLVHRCIMKGCRNVRRTAYYCEFHCCLSLTSASTYCDNYRVGEQPLKKHCAIHACIIINCSSKKIDNSNYCCDHACIIKNCGKKCSLRGGSYCDFCRKRAIFAMTVMMKRLRVVHDIQKKIQVLILRTIIRN